MRADKSSSTSKKYWVSAYYAIPRIISLCAFCLFFADMTISYIRRTSIIDASFYCIWGAFAVAVLLNVYLLLCDVKSFRVSFSEEGITLHTPVRKLFTSWNEIHHVRTFETQVHSGTNFTSCPLHWVIFSKRQVMTIDCRKILKCGSGRLRNNVVFHISPKLYDEIKMYFPEKFQDVLDPYIKYISLATDSLNRKAYR